MLVDGLDRPFKMVSDATRVYWVEYGDIQGGNGSVRSCPLTGCSGQPLVYATGQMEPKGVATDDDYVYWTTASSPPLDGGAAPEGGVWKCLVTGCNGAPIFVAPGTRPSDLTTDGVYVYWPDPGPNSVTKANLSTGQTEVLYDGGGDAIPYDVSEVVVDSKNVYVEDFATNVFRVPLTGGTPIAVATVASPNSEAYGLGIDSTNVYYGQGEAILAMNKSTQAITTLEKNLPLPVSFAVDIQDSLLYWASWGTGAGSDGKVGKVGINGSGATSLQTGLPTPQSVTLAGNYLYWISAGTIVTSSNESSVSVLPSTGALWRTAK